MRPGTSRHSVQSPAQCLAHRRGSDDICLIEAWMVRHPSTTSLLGKHLPWDLGTPWRQKPSAEGRGAAGWAGGTVPEPRMVGRALGGRDPVRELVLLLPLLLVPPPLHVSCREESWPGIEMDLAVDGGLGKTEVCDQGAPPSASEENRGAPPASGGLHPHSRLEAGVPREQEHPNGDL